MGEAGFLAQTLSSRQLLALLFVCEASRKGTLLSPDSFDSTPPAKWPEKWEEYLDTFADRLANLGEQTRLEVLEAHLMSVEDIDIYHDATLESLLARHRTVWAFLSDRLGSDPRFTLES